MIDWLIDLFPINRSITGDGLRRTLKYLSELLPNMKLRSVKSGTKVFDWIVPDEWNVKNAYIDDEYGNRVVDFSKNNLHLVGYSIPVDGWFDLEELDKHLYSLPNQPDAIPYVTSYYKKDWGFCLTHEMRTKLNPGKYHVVIESNLYPGQMNYGEVIIHGRNKKEILLSTYVCHPSMANNELSGPVVTTALVKWLLNQKELQYTYRILFLPETIGSITYLSLHSKKLKENVIAGYVITCVGDDRTFSYIPSRQGNTLADKAAKHILKHVYPKFKKYSFLERGSDERQYCSPGINLPVASVTRSKYHEYPEYHTSLDNLNLVTSEGLNGSFDVYIKIIEAIEKNYFPKSSVFCEPQLGKRGLYDSNKNNNKTSVLMNLIAYADGEASLLEIAEIINVPIWELVKISEKLLETGLLLRVKE